MQGSINCERIKVTETKKSGMIDRQVYISHPKWRHALRRNIADSRRPFNHPAIFSLCVNDFNMFEGESCEMLPECSQDEKL